MHLVAIATVTTRAGSSPAAIAPRPRRRCRCFRPRHQSLPSPAPHPGAHPRGAYHDPRSRDRDHVAGGRRCRRARGYGARRADAARRGTPRPRRAPPREAAPGAPGRPPRGVQPAELQAAAERTRAEERHRIATIQDAARKLGVAASIADDLVARGTSVDVARAALIDAAAARDAQAETRPHVRTGGLDASETRRSAVEAALLHRYDPGSFALSEAAREWRGLSLIEMARGWVEAEGVRFRGLSRDEIAIRALHSTSDFPAILAGVTNKTLRNAYETAPRTYPAIARRTTVADFKLVHRLQLGEAPQLEKVNQSGEFKRGTIGEAQETYRIETFGKVIGITRQVLINDDLDAFTRVPALFGTSAATLESDVVWGIFSANPAMADGAALFHASHKNLAAAGAALDVAGLAKARTAMAQQRGLDGKTLLNVRPSTWWCRAR